MYFGSNQLGPTGIIATGPIKLQPSLAILVVVWLGANDGTLRAPIFTRPTVIC